MGATQPRLPVLDLSASRAVDRTDIAARPTVSGPPAPPVRFGGQQLRADKHYLGCAHRGCAPEQTLERVRQHLRDCGITRIADITGLDRINDVPVVLAMRPNSMTLANAAGKGVTTAAATVSAVMEGIELHHAEQSRLRWRAATHRQLAADGRHIPFELLPRTRYSLLHQDSTTSWVDACDLVSGDPVPVPLDLVRLCRAGQDPPISGDLQVSSNGLASGNHLLEAICHGMYEVIERDAVALATMAHPSRGSLTERRIDPSTATDPMVTDLLGRLESAAVGVALYDVTSDLGVPTYLARVVDLAERRQGHGGGYGCHLDPGIAMVRAITEAVQGRTVAIAGSRDDIVRDEHTRLRRRDDDTAMASFRSGTGTPLTGQVVTGATPNFEGDIATLVERIRSVGLHQVLAVDLTDDRMGIPVVRVVVPGLEGHRSPSYAPGPRAERAARPLERP